MTTTTHRRSRVLRAAPVPLLAAGLLALSACSGNGSTASAAGTGSAGSSGTVQVAKRGGTLQNAAGRTLYVSDLERHKVLCTSGACTAIWSPLTVTGRHRPTGPGKVGQELSTLKRPDGTSQVTYDGRPLYTFSFDHGAGQVNGDGATDSFDGHDFTWHAARASASAGGGPSAPSSSSRGGYGY
jgi:predicted lipoprotein with Yx(FWY)xxD motif